MRTAKTLRTPDGGLILVAGSLGTEAIIRAFVSHQPGLVVVEDKPPAPDINQLAAEVSKFNIPYKSPPPERTGPFYEPMLKRQRKKR